MKAALVSGLLMLAASAAEPVTERVFGPEIKTGPYKHPACLTELSNGDLYLVYYGGAGEYAVDTGVFGTRRKRGEKAWSAPVRIAADPFRSVGNGVIWQAPDGLVWLFYVVRYGGTWSSSRIQGKVSRDNAVTWSDSFVVSQEEGMMVRNRPIVLASGEYLLPAYLERGEDRESVGADSTSRFLRFDAKAKAWVPSGVIRSAKGNIQPAVAEVAPGHLIAFCRRGGGYGPGSDGFLVYSESNDNGKTWAEGRDSQFPNPNSAIDLIKLRDGALLLVYNHSGTERHPLTAALSADGGKTWPVRRNLGETKETYAYPAAVQSSDGKIHVVYTTSGRTIIEHMTLDESWIRGER